MSGGFTDGNHSRNHGASGDANLQMVGPSLARSGARAGRQQDLQMVGLRARTNGARGRRQGHTELAVGLARLSGMIPVVIGAEMLQPDGDFALPVDDARKWAEDREIPFLTGEELIKALGL